MTDQQPLPRRKSIRLDRDRYADTWAICSITIAVTARRPVFADPLVATSAVEVLNELAQKTCVVVHGYCVMPDHVHLILSPSPSCDLITFLGQFKNLVQRAAWRHGVVGRFCQRRFWDHFLRADEDVKKAVAYVLRNPVRAGLVADWREYPFAGPLQWGL